jgi:phosphatidyl-myo-inositol dimannoside synthase
VQAERAAPAAEYVSSSRDSALPEPGDSSRRLVALFTELLGVGGIQEASRLTAAALVDIASRRRWSTDFLSLNDPPGVHALPSPFGSISFRGFGRAKVRFSRSAFGLARKPTRVVLAAHPYLALPAAQLKLLNPKLKVIVVSHGVEVWKRLPVLRRLAFRRADLFLAPSRHTVDKIVEVHHIAAAKTRRVAWPVNPVFLDMAGRGEVLRAPARFPDGLILLAVARLVANERYKGVDQLIRAVAQLAPRHPSLQLAVVGRGDDLERHQELAASLGIASRVQFFDNISPAETAACYSSCDVFALPSTGEGFGLVFLEAMAFGKPVVGAAAGGVTDIIEHGQNGLLVPAGDLNGLIETLERLLTSESLRISLGSRGAQMVRSRYSFETFCSDLERVLGDCGLA